MSCAHAFLLQWLEVELLGYLSDWERSVMSRNGFTAAKKKLTLMPESTMEWNRITGGNPLNLFYVHIDVSPTAVKSFTELSRSLLSKPGVQYLFSERFTQDPLESFFGPQRSSGGWSDNPSVQQFLDGTVSLRVQGSMALKQIRGKCRKDPYKKIRQLTTHPYQTSRRKKGNPSVSKN